MSKKLSESASNTYQVSTEEDYENAPEGTIVAPDGPQTYPWQKIDGLWVTGFEERTALEMAQKPPTRVLRRGWSG